MFYPGRQVPSGCKALPQNHRLNHEFIHFGPSKPAHITGRSLSLRKYGISFHFGLPVIQLTVNRRVFFRDTFHGIVTVCKMNIENRVYLIPHNSLNHFIICWATTITFWQTSPLIRWFENLK